MQEESNAGIESTQGKSMSILFKVATWAITCFCFYLVLSKTQTTAAREGLTLVCLLYTSPSPRDATLSRMPSSA